MLDYIQRNKEWLFSGVAVALIGVIYTLLRNFLVKRTRKHFNEPSSVVQHEIQAMSGLSSGFSVKRILDEIDAAPPYQKDAIEESFKGIYVRPETFLEPGRPSQKEVANSAIPIRIAQKPASVAKRGKNRPPPAGAGSSLKVKLS